jgi:hypothetical protein
VSKGADYLTALKGNQSTLHDDVILFFENTPKSYEGTLNTYKSIDSGHGCIEERTVTSCNRIDWLTEHHTHLTLPVLLALNQEGFLRMNGQKKRDTLLVALSITMQRNLLTM